MLVCVYISIYLGVISNLLNKLCIYLSINISWRWFIIIHLYLCIYICIYICDVVHLLTYISILVPVHIYIYIYILTIRRILAGVGAKNLDAMLLLLDFSQAFESIHWEKMEQILLASLKKPSQPQWSNIKHESKSSLTRSRHRLFCICSRCATRRYISSIPFYYLSRLRA